MAKLDSKKIDGIIKQLENAGKGAIRVLNEMTDNSFKDSPLEKDPFTNLGLIVNTLQQAREQAKLNAKYDGMNEEEIAAAQAQERVTERESLQQLAQEKLAKRQAKEPETEPVEAAGEQ